MLNLSLKELHELSITHPEKVWDELAKEVAWSKPYTSVIDDKDSPLPNWFIGGEINMSYNCLDKAIEEGYGDDVAVIYESPVTNTTQKITFKDLLESVALLAGVMVEKCGIKKGDVVLLYFPVTPQCLIGMLACTRIGATHSVVFGGFPPKAICARIQHTEPKLILTCNVGLEPGLVINYKEKIDKAIEISTFKPDYCLIYNRPNTIPATMIGNRDLDWSEELKTASPQGPIPVESNHPMLIIYTSGTTGEPKGLVMATGNSVVIDKYKMKYIYNLKPKECWWMLSDFVWISGQTDMSYGPLLTRTATIILEGKYVSDDDPSLIGKVLKRHKVVSFLSSPTVMRILRNTCNELDLQLEYPDLRAFYTGGEISDSQLRQWVSKTFNVPVYEIWGQTELNGAVTSPALSFGRPIKSNSICMLGIKPKVIDTRTGTECQLGVIGTILLKTPMYPGVATTLYKYHDRYLRSYFTKHPGYYDTMDWGKLHPDGSLEILSRSDDIIHVSSIRICGGAVEEICLKNEDLISAAVIPMDDQITGQVPFGFLIKRNDATHSDKEIINNTVNLVKNDIGEFALFQHAVIVPDFPRTNSHKISKYSLAAMVNGKEYKVPSTVSNPDIYKVIYDVLTTTGYAATLPIYE